MPAASGSKYRETAIVFFGSDPMPADPVDFQKRRIRQPDKVAASMGIPIRLIFFPLALLARTDASRSRTKLPRFQHFFLILDRRQKQFRFRESASVKLMLSS